MAGPGPSWDLARGCPFLVRALRRFGQSLSWYELSWQTGGGEERALEVRSSLAIPAELAGLGEHPRLRLEARDHAPVLLACGAETRATGFDGARRAAGVDGSLELRDGDCVEMAPGTPKVSVREHGDGTDPWLRFHGGTSEPPYRCGKLWAVGGEAGVGRELPDIPHVTADVAAEQAKAIAEGLCDQPVRGVHRLP